jgi:Zn-dependent protease with chaperone function
MSERASGSFFGNVKQETEAYIQARIHLFQLDITEKISRLSGVIAVVFMLAILLLLVMLGLSLMAGYYFADRFQSNFFGFALVAGFYFLLFIILWMVRKRLATFIADKMVQTIFNATAGIKEIDE